MFEPTPMMLFLASSLACSCRMKTLSAPDVHSPAGRCQPFSRGSTLTTTSADRGRRVCRPGHRQSVWCWSYVLLGEESNAQAGLHALGSMLGVFKITSSKSNCLNSCVAARPRNLTQPSFRPSLKVKRRPGVGVYGCGV